MKGSTVSKDYSALEKELAGDMSAAAASVALTAGASKKIKLATSHLPRVIPNGAVIEVQAVNFTKLEMGDFICVSSGRETVVRRFVKLKMTKSDTYLLTAYEGFEKKEALPKGALIGKVISVTAQGRTFDPRKEEGLFAGFWGKLTEYGTHKAFGVFG